MHYGIVSPTRENLNLSSLRLYNYCIFSDTIPACIAFSETLIRSFSEVAKIYHIETKFNQGVFLTNSFTVFDSLFSSLFVLFHEQTFPVLYLTKELLLLCVRQKIFQDTLYINTKAMVSGETDCLILFFFVIIKRTIKLIITT